MRLEFLAVLMMIWTSAASAQYAEVPNTPRAVVQGTTIGIWAENSLVGKFVMVAKQAPQGWFGIYSSTIMSDTDFANAINAAGGYAAYIVTLKPAIDTALAKAFPTSGGVPVPPVTGDAAIDGINLALATSFKFTVSADGKVATFGPK